MNVQDVLKKALANGKFGGLEIPACPECGASGWQFGFTTVDYRTWGNKIHWLGLRCQSCSFKVEVKDASDLNRWVQKQTYRPERDDRHIGYSPLAEGSGE